MDQREQLKSMLQNIINGKEEDAAVIVHDYIVAKTRQVTGLGAQQESDLSTDVEEAAKEQ